jgi:hypothetical protein
MPRKYEHEESNVATLPPADPAAIAAKVAELEHDKRTSRTIADLERWREIVVSVAAGKEPDGQQLADIGAICVRLKLPPDALAIHVAALVQHGRHATELDRTRQAMQDTRARRDELFAKIKRLEKELLDARLEIEHYQANAGGLPGMIGAKNEIESKYPVMFGQLEQVAERFLDAGVGTVSRPVAATATAWEG